MKKYLLTFFLTLFFVLSANAGTDGTIELSKNKPKNVKDCLKN